MAGRGSDLTTTSYALLSLLAVKPFTTYELARQMERSLRDVWPRAESVIYEEPKRLVSHGYATAKAQRTGGRRGTRYAITAKGRRVLRAWLEEPGRGPVLEFEGLLKVAFADHGDVEALRRNIDAIRRAAEARVAYVDERIREYDETGGPFPDRLPVVMLIARFQHEHAAAILRWAEWASGEVRTWHGVTVGMGARVPTTGAE